MLTQVVFGVVDGHPIHARTAFVLSNAFPRCYGFSRSHTSSINCSVGTLIEAWASMKSFRPKDGGGEPPAPGRNGERDFHGEKRRNETHAATTGPDARLYRKGPGQPVWDTF